MHFVEKKEMRFCLQVIFHFWKSWKIPNM